MWADTLCATYTTSPCQSTLSESLSPRTVSLPGTRPQAASKKCQLLNAVTNLTEIYYYIKKGKGEKIVSKWWFSRSRQKSQVFKGNRRNVRNTNLLRGGLKEDYTRCTAVTSAWKFCVWMSKSVTSIQFNSISYISTNATSTVKVRTNSWNKKKDNT